MNANAEIEVRPPPSMQILNSADDFMIAKLSKNLLVSVWATSGHEELGQLVRAMEMMAASNGDVVSTLWLKEGTPPPQGESREVLVDMINKTNGKVLRMDVIASGSGFWIAANRAAAATYRLLGRGFPIYYSDDYAGATSRSGELGGRSATDVRQAFDHMRATIGA